MNAPFPALAQRARMVSAGPIARASIASMAIKLAALVLSFAQTILVARALGTGGLGVFAFAMSVVQVVATLAALGYGRFAVREIPALEATGRRDEVPRFVRTALGMVMAVSFAASAGLAALAWWTELFPADYRSTIAVAALLVSPIALNQTRAGLLQGLGHAVRSQLTGELIRRVVVIVLLGVLLVAGYRLDPTGFVLVVLAGAGVVLVVGMRMIGRAMTDFTPPETRQSTGNWRWRGLPFLALALTALMQNEANTLLLGIFSTTHEAGLYQPVASLALLLMLPVQAAGVKFAPEAARLWSRGEMDKLREISFALTWTTMLLTSCGALAAIVAGPWVLGLYGPDFLVMVPALWLVAGVQVFNAACGPVGMLQIATGRSKATLLVQLGGLATVVAVSAALVPAQGAFGAVVALAAGVVFTNLAHLILLVATTGIVPILPPRKGA